MTGVRKVRIVQPYVPSYRVPMFELLRELCFSQAIDVRVVAGKPVGTQALRGDAVDAEWVDSIKERVIRVGSRALEVSSSRATWRNAHAVIVPHQGSSLDANRALMRMPRSRFKVGVWGHIAPYTAPPHPVDAAIERWQLRRADRIFAYTEGGAQFAETVGVATDRITTLQNAVDSTQLTMDVETISHLQVREYRARYVPSDGWTLLAFIGGLDASKNISLLAESLRILHDRRAKVHVVIAGSGEQLDLLRPAVERGTATYVGRVNGEAKALLLKSCDAIVNPGRIGLIAVDALVARKKILSTNYPFHAPEVDYLEEGHTLIRSDETAEAFASTMQEASGKPVVGPTRPVPSIEAMASNFAEGIARMLDDR